MSLRAPIAVPVEIRAPARRVLRLAWNIGEDGIRLAGNASFEHGRPVDVRFDLPDGETLSLRAEIAGGDVNGDVPADELLFVEPSSEARMALRSYVLQRLGLPS